MILFLSLCSSKYVHTLYLYLTILNICNNLYIIKSDKTYIYFKFVLMSCLFTGIYQRLAKRKELGNNGENNAGL